MGLDTESDTRWSVGAGYYAASMPLILVPLRWRQKVLPKCWYLSTILHDVTFQKIICSAQFIELIFSMKISRTEKIIGNDIL
jgi:hypothetical protein